MEFEWNADKAQRNLRKHHVTFLEAVMVFNDSFAITYYDDAHSDYEQRFVTLGMSDRGRVLVVSHTLSVKTIRLISARKATLKERKVYAKEKR